MIRNDINILIGVKKATMRIAASCLLLFFLAGNAMAQSGRFVIKKKAESDTDIHYLAHVKVEENWVLQDATSFSPACLWISDNTYCPGGTNKNYYFYDDNNTPRFLASPVFQEGGALTLSTTIPSGSDLGTPEYQYYFYRWDSGLGRGVQYYGVTDQTCTHHWEWNQAHTDGECWEVYWVAYDAVSGTWKLSDMHYDLDDTPNGARYHDVTITEYTQDTTTLNNSGLTPLLGFSLEWEGSPQTISPSITTPYSYYFTPAYTEYVVNESYYGHEPNPINVQHNYWGGEDHGDEVPGQVDQSESRVVSLSWTITGDAADYLSFSDVVGSNVTTSNDDAPTLYYSTQNTTGDKTATLRLVVTYENGAKQTSTATVTVLTPCQNPDMIGAPEVTETGVTLSWYPTATSYLVSWQKAGASTWNSVGLGNVTSYTIRGLDFATTYYYKVRATSCTTDDPTPGSFTTLEEPEGLVLFGAVFGGGRMADVHGKTEVVIINANDINAVYGGNDIAGKVRNENGSTITLGVNENDPNTTYDTDYGHTTAAFRIGDVYGGGNGYYAYNGSSFVPATDTYSSHEVAANGHVNAMTQEHEVGEVVWTNTGTEPKTLEFPSIAKTNITVTNDYVKVDSLFGGAKNAFLTNTTNDVNITINGGTLFTVFGGNNFGGTLGADSQEHIVVNNTATETENYHSLQLGRDFGIGYLFGGGNKVEGRNVQIDILGGQMDTIFGGGNAADVLSTQLTVNCALAAGSSGPQFGKVFSEAITECSGESPNFTLTIDDNYNWKCSGIYNVRTLFGGNNRADMEGGVPNLILTSGSIGTVYGGGNAGDMKDSEHTDINFDDLEPFGVDYSTHVVMNSPTMLVDYLYGGCQMSNVLYSTWVELQKGHVGTVYGGCNISGDVGSTRVNPNAPYIPVTLEDQEVKGGTYVKAGGSADDNVIVYNNLIAGSNGYYDCSQDGIHYKGDSNFDDPTGKYDGLTVPTHNETHAIISDGATIKGNVYAGGNLACVGFDDGTGFYRGFPELIGLASLRMDGGTVNGNVYGGGNLASIYGINEVRVSGGTIGLALYGGNDCSGQVAEKTNRLLPDEYTVASDDVTSLTALGVKTYVGVSGNPQINTVYGGGNGVYAPEEVEYCYSNFEPVQSYTFVDIHIDGGTNGGHIGTVYGGGNGVTVRHGVTVFLNVQGTDVEEDDNNHVDVVFGGNNKGDLNVVSDIILLHGKVGTVYGGCNQGAMIATDRVKNIGGYENIGSYVRLMDTYDPDGVPEHLETVTAKVTDAVYGGCRMNGVTNNSLVLVEGGNHSGISLYGGSDISGTVSGKSMVATVGGTVGNVYGGGNGGYYYVEDVTTGIYTVYKDADHTQLLATGIGGAPSCNYSGVDIWSGQVGVDPSHTGQVFGGGYGQLTVTNRDVVVNIGDAEATSAAATPIIYGDIYGGSALGNVNFPAVGYHTTVNFMNGTLKGNLYGGGLGQQQIGEDPATAIAAKSGGVYVTISSADQNEANCFIDLRQANIFGCNNANGSPQDDVEVHVWKTGYITGDYDSQSGTLYAIDQVFGGGNQADYRPAAVGSGETPHKTLVFVHDCVNTIRRVFSGGNAADASKVAATIDGGRFNYVFGGGNGEVTAANIGDGGTDLLVKGGKINHLFGGSNKNGSISGTINTVVNNESGCAEEIYEFFGGSNLAPLTLGSTSQIHSVIDCCNKTIHEAYGGSKSASISGDVVLDVKGGTIFEVYGGSKGCLDCGEGGTPIAANITGNVTLNLEGGVIGDYTGGTSGNDFGGAFGGSNVNGNITGSITVNVIDIEQCPLDVTNIYGAGNQADYTPTDPTITSPVVNVMHLKPIENGLGIRKNVFGGGNEAVVTANPKVNIGYDATSMSSIITALGINTGSLTSFPHVLVTGSVFGGGNVAQVDGSITVNVYNGEIVHKLVGGGNSLGVTGDVVNVGVTGNVVVNISGGNVCTAIDGLAGVYGGCNESGVVNGDITLNITGDNNTQTTIGTQAALINHEPVSVHGGGFGDKTHTNGNVTINYGTGGGAGTDCEYPMLYGELYGGSALGTVNDEASEETTITILNGSVKFVLEGETQYGGKIFGGGRGQEGDASKGQVNGEIHVNIGGGIGEDAYGKANLKGCYIFGCNNTNGSPQQHVYVDVYQTKHVDGDYVDDEGDLWDNYAIRNVYGGGNVAHYQPTVNPDNKKKVHNRIHNCGNTIEYVYGGGNAANTIGTEVSVDGGRFKYIFGGGNGQVVPANIGMGGVNISIYGGHVGWYFSSCNLHGTVEGGTVEQYGCTDTYCPCYPDTLVVEKYYFGANKALTVGGLSHIINCGDNMNFKYVYGGSRLAVVYGDIKLWVRGGTIENLIAGNEGSMEVQADVKKYPAADYDWYTNPDGHPGEVKTYLDEQHALGNDLYGLGGNLQLVLEGGKLGNVYGGNDFRGNVEGNITVIIDSTQAHPCQLDIDYLYAGNHLSGYTPDSLNHQVHLDPNRISPLVYFKNGHVNYDVFGGSEGGDPSHPFGNGLVVSNPKLVIGNPSNSEHKARVGRDLFGGGSAAKVEGNPIVVLQGKTTVGGNVFGGGKSGDIVGGTDVVIDPDSPIDPPATPIPPKHKLFIQTAGPANAGIVSVKYYENNVEHIVHDGDEVPEGSILQIVATPNTGYLFVEWWTDFGHIEHPTYATTTCLMGSKNTILKATFRSE